MKDSGQITIEGFTVEELLSLPEDEFEKFVFCGEPVAFKAGSAEVLGQFRIDADSLIIELAHIDGGGEGVLIAIWLLAERWAASRNLTKVEWIVHALHCARPNPKLRRVLDLKGFKVEEIPGIGEVYHYVHNITGNN
jgi:hypothetical protein